MCKEGLWTFKTKWLKLGSMVVFKDENVFVCNNCSSRLDALDSDEGTNGETLSSTEEKCLMLVVVAVTTWRGNGLTFYRRWRRGEFQIRRIVTNFWWRQQLLKTRGNLFVKVLEVLFVSTRQERGNGRDGGYKQRNVNVKSIRNLLIAPLWEHKFIFITVNKLVTVMPPHKS